MAQLGRTWNPGCYSSLTYRAQYGTAGSKYPVVTFVLYFGLEKEWEKEISLKECFDILPELEEYVNDYKVKVFSIAFLPPEKVQQFKSDFQIVADYFVQKHMTQNYIPNPQTLVHVQETLQLLSIMGNDNRFEKAYNSSAEGGPHNMCDVLDRVEKQGVDLMAKLMSILFKEKRFADAERASEDEAYREKLLKEYNLKQ